MKKFLLILITVLPTTLFAQKLLKPAVDKITGDTTWNTSKEKLYIHGNYLTGQAEGVITWVKVNKLGKALILNPQTTNQRSVFMLTKDDKAYLKLSDNTTITLVCATNDIGRSGAFLAGDNVITNGSAFGIYDLTPEDIEKLSTTALTFLRIESSSGNFDCEIKSKNAEMFKKQFALVAKLK
ncbi:hypothetical protein FPZ43_14705 [Mucilaginibacter pallidiroseus]|uniref:Uncharacterized protein n=1 Tax=Mucilaginibacter pallidiroseus TaxID=2599295 RepID=A0A563U522_9SPHI|nr:hypothetical protein [Mucilaginibacter pallidiroseus]TWR26412.1 hypothetical protein FPZ43_14705 [Mucilaginibacter pallidiroseus]